MTTHPIPLGSRTIANSNTSRRINIPADAREMGFPDEGEVQAFYDLERRALIYTPLESEENSEEVDP